MKTKIRMRNSHSGCSSYICVVAHLPLSCRWRRPASGFPSSPLMCQSPFCHTRTSPMGKVCLCLGSTSLFETSNCLSRIMPEPLPRSLGLPFTVYIFICATLFAISHPQRARLLYALFFFLFKLLITELQWQYFAIIHGIRWCMYKKSVKPQYKIICAFISILCQCFRSTVTISIFSLVSNFTLEHTGNPHNYKHFKTM